LEIFIDLEEKSLATRAKSKKHVFQFIRGEHAVFLHFICLSSIFCRYVLIQKEIIIINEIINSLIDPFNCDQWSSCDSCIQHNPCGWCELNVRYTDGTLGPQCAGKPRDPNNPPPGYRPCIIAKLLL
jgi:hypothetical protein